MHVGESAEKKDVLERLLELGMVLVALDARADGVDVPDHLGRDPQLRLNLSYRFGLPMSVDPWGIDATLTFGGVPYACRFPWGAIYLLVSHVNGEPYLFPDEVPSELLAQVGVEGAWSLPNDRQRPAPSNRPKLSLVVSADEADVGRGEGAATAASTDDATPARRSSAGAEGQPMGAARPAPRRGGRATARRTPEVLPAEGEQPVANPEKQAPGEPRKVPTAHAAQGPEAPAQGPRAVDGASGTPGADGTDDVPSGGGPGRRRGHLRLVK